MADSAERADRGGVELVLAAGDGDRAAWAELLRGHDGLVRAIVRGYRLQAADSADAQQSTWLRAMEGIGRLRDPASFGGWLATIAHRECMAVLRRARRERAVDELPDVAATAPGPEEIAVHAEHHRRVAEVVAGLPDRKRLLLHQLFAAERPDYAAVALRTGMAVGSIGPTRARALDDLRRRLSQAGLVGGDAAA